MPDARSPAASAAIERLVLQIVMGINARAIYPAEHPRIQEAVERLVTSLDSLLATQQQHSITLFLLDQELVVDQQPFRSSGLQLRGFLLAMRRLGVEGLTLLRGLEVEECHRFLEAIATSSSAVSTEHILVGRVQVGFAGGGAEGEAQAGTGTGAGAGRSVGSGVTTAQLELARESFQRFRGDRKGGLGMMEGLVWGFVDTLAQSAQMFFPLAPLREHDELTYVHSVNVSLSTLCLARALGYHGDLLKDIGLAALLHDIGKLSLPASVLQKAGPLDDQEWQMMRRHPELGSLQLCDLDAATTLPVLVAYEHHLRYDGQPNYPFLQAPRQPVFASLMTSVADTYDAVRTTRSYQNSIARPAALAILRKKAGTFLDPILVETFCRLMEPGRAAEQAS